MSASSEWAIRPAPRLAGGPRGRRRLTIVALWSLAVLVSALQIYLRDAHRGAPAPWPDVLVANLVAWLPWLLVAAPALRLERRFPLAGLAWRRHAALHLALASGFALAFLLYLSGFHVVHLERRELSLAGLRGEYGEQLGRFFMTAVALYYAIVVAGFAERAWRGQRRRRREAEASRGPLPRPAALVVRSTGRVVRIDPAEVSRRGVAGRRDRPARSTPWNSRRPPPAPGR